MRDKGFSIIEVLAATAIVAGLGGAIYKLQLTSLASSQQIITRQLMIQYSDNLINQMNEHLNFIGYSAGALYTLSMEPGAYSDALNQPKNGYVETVFTTYAQDGTYANCSTRNCDDNQLAKYLINTWKKHLKLDTNLPENNVSGIVCRDQTMAVPSMTDPHCSNSGPLVLKVIWQPKNQSTETTGLGGHDDNYIIMKIAGR